VISALSRINFWLYIPQSAQRSAAFLARAIEAIDSSKANSIARKQDDMRSAMAGMIMIIVWRGCSIPTCFRYL
jgi:hypothetical protein